MIIKLIVLILWVLFAGCLTYEWKRDFYDRSFEDFLRAFVNAIMMFIALSFVFGAFLAAIWCSVSILFS